MKFLITPLILSLSIVTSYSQIHKNCKTIIVKHVGFLEVCNMLLDKNYKIEKKDNELQTVETTQTEYIKSFNATFIIEVRVKDSTAYITGNFTAPPGGGLAYKEPIYNVVDKNGVTKVKTLSGYPFSKLVEFAKAFNKEVEFIKP